MSFFLCSCLKAVEDNSVSLSFIIKGESADIIKTLISGWGIIVLSITPVNQEPQDYIYIMQGDFACDIYLRTEDDVVIAALDFSIPYTTILDEKKLLATDLINRINKEKKEKYEAEIMKNEEKKLREEEVKKKFTDTRLASIKEIMNYLSEESALLIERSKSYNDVKKTKSFTDVLDEVKKVRMGTNIDKMIIACDAVYNHIQSFLQAKHSNPDLTKPIQGSVITNQDIIDILIAYHKAQYSKRSFTSHSADDRLFLVFEKLGIFRKLFGLEQKHRLGSTGFLGHNILVSIDMAWVVMGVGIGIMSLRLKILNDTNPIIYLILLYYGIGSISRWVSRLLVHVTDTQTLGIWAGFFGVICIGGGYLITKTFGL